MRSGEDLTLTACSLPVRGFSAISYTQHPPLSLAYFIAQQNPLRIGSGLSSPVASATKGK
jgi:hypothetical protein